MMGLQQDAAADHAAATAGGRPRSHRPMEQRCLRARRLHRAAADSRVRLLHPGSEQWRLRPSAYDHRNVATIPSRRGLQFMCTARSQASSPASAPRSDGHDPTPLIEDGGHVLAPDLSSPAPPSRHPGGWRLSELPWNDATLGVACHESIALCQ